MHSCINELGLRLWLVFNKTEAEVSMNRGRYKKEKCHFQAVDMTAEYHNIMFFNVCLFIYLFIYLFILRETEYKQERDRERRRERIPGRLCAVSTEPNARLYLTNPKTMT